jgi:hypothetical protein
MLMPVFLFLWQGQDSAVNLNVVVWFIDSDELRGESPPSDLVLGVDVNREVLYKLSDETRVLKGGLFFPGFNTLTVNAEKFFDKPGNHLFYLEVKSGPVIQKEELEILVQMPEIEEQPPPAEDVDVLNFEYQVTMYVGDQMVASSTKILKEKAPPKVEMPKYKARWEPFGPPDDNDPSTSSFPILGAAAAAAKLIKGLVDKKNEENMVKPLIKTRQVNVSFKRLDYSGSKKEINAVVTLRQK